MELIDLVPLALRAQEHLEKISQLSAAEAARQRLQCPVGCGECCFSPTVEASEIEFLPLALSWWRSGELEYYLEKLQLALEAQNPRCILFSLHTKGGHCRCYPYRGLICRAFGLSKIVDKYGHARWSICRHLAEFPLPTCAEQSLLPTLAQWRWQFANDFPGELTCLLPINQALYQICSRVQQRIDYGGELAKQACSRWESSSIHCLRLCEGEEHGQVSS